VFETLGSGGGTLRFREADAPMRRLRHHAEQAVGLLVKGARELTQRRAIPLCVEFTHAQPNEPVDYTAIVGCPVRFQAEWHAVIFSKETLRLPVVGADNRLLRTLQGACRRIVGPQPRKEDLVHSIRQFVVDRLSKGAPGLDEVAGHFNMSSKTLERRLADHDARYRELVDGVRCELAKHYLARTDLRLHQIAYALGYAEPAPLARAFKRWTALTPMQYRHKHR
jgi:AraC-like DNA-binding protein